MFIKIFKAMLFSVVLATALQADFVPAKSFTDGEGRWSSESKAYQNVNNGAYDRSNRAGAGAWLALRFQNPVLSNHIRVNARFGSLDSSLIDLEVRLEGAEEGDFISVFNGSIPHAVSTIIDMPPVSVVEVRYRNYDATGNYSFILSELNIYETREVIGAPVAETSPATSVEGNSAIIHSLISDDTGDLCQARLQYGSTSAYGQNSPWVNELVTGSETSSVLSGLSSGVEYHYRVQYRRSEGTEILNGLDQTFVTSALDPLADNNWVSPTGASAVAGSWTNLDLSRDDHEGTFASLTHEPNDDQWSDYIELSHDSLVINGFRFAAVKSDFITLAQVDVLGSGNIWINKFEGSFSDGGYQEIYFEKMETTKARIRFYNRSKGSRLDWFLNEFDFHQQHSKIWLGQAGGDNLWSSPSNWNGGVLPEAGHDVIFSGLSDIQNCVIDIDAVVSSIRVKDDFAGLVFAGSSDITILGSGFHNHLEKFLFQNSTVRMSGGDQLFEGAGASRLGTLSIGKGSTELSFTRKSLVINSLDLGRGTTLNVPAGKTLVLDDLAIRGYWSGKTTLKAQSTAEADFVRINLRGTQSIAYGIFENINALFGSPLLAYKKCEDHGGNSGIYFSSNATPPRLSLKAPSSTSAFLVGENVSMEVEVLNPQAGFVLNSVEFYMDGSYLSTDSLYPYTSTWLAEGEGEHLLRVLAIFSGPSGEALGELESTFQVIDNTRGAYGELSHAQSSAQIEVWKSWNNDSLSEFKRSLDFPANPEQRLLSSGLVVGSKAHRVTRLRVYVTPIKSGSYIFSLPSGVESELLVSPSIDSSDAQSIPLNTPEGSALSSSDPVSLISGQEFYLELLFKSGSEATTLSLTWNYSELSDVFDSSRTYPIPASQFRAVDFGAPELTLSGYPNQSEINKGLKLDIEAKISNQASEVLWVQFYRQATSTAGSKDKNAPYTRRYTLKSSVLDVHAEATMSDGRVIKSLTKSFTPLLPQGGVVLPAEPPEVSLVLPAADQATQKGGNAQLHARVEKVGAGFDKVEFFKEDTKIGESLNFPYQLDTVMDAQSVFEITAVATVKEDTFESALSVQHFVFEHTFSPEGTTSSLGGVLRENWTGVSGSKITDLPKNSDFPENPDELAYSSSLEASGPLLPSFGTRLRGYIHAPLSGDYRFWVSGDDDVELWLSEDSEQANLKKLAWTSEATGFRSWTQKDSQVSASVTLSAGQKYYVEVLHKQDTDESHLSVGWLKPGGELERPISGSYLSPWVQNTSAPEVSLKNPVSGTSLNAGNDLELIAYAKAGSGNLLKVEFFSGDQKLGEVSSAPYRLVWTDIPPAEHQLWAKVSDDTNGVGYSLRTLLRVNTKDSDGDGLNDRDEKNSLGTNTKSDDSDGDGLNDDFEMMVDFLNPSVADANLGLSEILSINGADIQYTTGDWTVVGTALQGKKRRGMVGQDLVITENDMYFIGLEITEGIATKTTACRILFYLDGLYLGDHKLNLVPGETQVAMAHTPFILAGSHRLEIVWDEVHKKRGLKIESLSLSVREGADSDGNGTKDWLEPWLAKTCTIATPLTSRVSPACIEGADHLPELSDISSLLQTWSLTRGAGSTWWTNLPLSAGGVTDYSLNFQNGAYGLEGQVEWVVSNMLEMDSIYVRDGDSLQLTIQPDNAAEGTVSLNISGNTHDFDLSSPLVHTFNTAGSFDITGTYESPEGAILTAQMQVIVVGRTAMPVDPYIVRNRSRWLWWENFPEHAVLESSLIRINHGEERLKYTPSGNFMIPAFGVYRTDSEKPATLMLRVADKGLILNSLRTKGLWARSGVDGHYYLKETLEDGTEIVETRLYIGHFDPSLSYQGYMATGGSLYEDGSTRYVFPIEDFNDVGIYNINLIRPEGIGSVCNRLLIYQDGDLIFIK